MDESASTRIKSHNCRSVPGPETPLLGGVSPVSRWSNREERPGNVTLNARCNPKGQLSNPKLNCRALEENLTVRALTKHEKVVKSPRWFHPYRQSCLCETGWLPLCPASALTHWFHSTELSFWSAQRPLVRQGVGFCEQLGNKWTGTQRVLMHSQATFGLMWNIWQHVTLCWITVTPSYLSVPHHGLFLFCINRRTFWAV